MATVRNAPGFHAAAEAQFNTYEAALSTHCKVVQPDWSKATHLLYGDAESAMDGNLVNATWVESVPGTACGQSRRYRVLVIIRAGKASVVSVLPGESFAGPQLENDAKLPLSAAVTAYWLSDEGRKEDSFRKATAPARNTCGNDPTSPDAGPQKDPTTLRTGQRTVSLNRNAVVDVIDTRLAGPLPKAGKQPWGEVWTVSNCGRKLAVPIQFVPDAVGEGTSIHIASKEIKPLE